MRLPPFSAHFGMSFFVASARFGDVGAPLVVAGAIFGDAGVSPFVAGAAFSLQVQYLVKLG